MKQIIIVFIAFVVLTVDAYSQEVNAQLGVPRRGYRGFVDLNGEALFEKKYSNDRDIVYSVSGFTTTHGYQFNEHFFVGGGVGIEFITYNFDRASFAIDYPLFATGRADWRLGKVPLFADLRLGTFIKSLRGYTTDKLYIAPAIGYHCAWGGRISLNFGAGVSMHWLDRPGSPGWKVMPSIKIGIEFK